MLLQKLFYPIVAVLKRAIWIVHYFVLVVRTLLSSGTLQHLAPVVILKATLATKMFCLLSLCSCVLTDGEQEQMFLG